MLIRILKLFFVSAFFGLLAGAAGSEPFLADRYWNSGKAEFQKYDALIARYGILRQSDVKIIVVKEPFDLKKLVKSAKSPDEVIKMNFICTVPTGVYDYFQMASFFFERSTGTLLKYTMSSQDGCGITYMQYVNRSGRHDFTFHSYFDEEGDFETSFSSDERLYFYDALPLLLRFELTNKQEYDVDLVPSLISNRIIAPAVLKAHVRNRLEKSLGLADRPPQNYYVSTVTYNSRADTFYFETAFPHRLVQWQMAGGERLQMTASRFFYYWQHTAPGETLQSVP